MLVVGRHSRDMQRILYFSLFKSRMNKRFVQETNIMKAIRKKNTLKMMIFRGYSRADHRARGWEGRAQYESGRRDASFDRDDSLQADLLPSQGHPGTGPSDERERAQKAREPHQKEEENP
jgi:hypothetical protein